MDVAVRVQAKVTGQRRSPVGAHPVIVTVPAGPLDAGMFLDSVVAAEVAAYARRAEERTFLRVLTEPALQADLRQGRVRSGEAEAVAPVDLPAAVAEARLAFADGLFKVFVDDVEVEGPDSPVTVTDGSEVLFLRLVPLAGG